jgi:hypothetical protein
MFMSSMKIFVVMVATLASCTLANAKDVDRSKSIGYAESIGGPKGLSFGIGLGDSHLESIFGGSYFSGNSISQATFLTAGLGVHYHLLRAHSASFSVGARMNVGSGSIVTSTTSEQGLETQIRSTDIVQWGFDIPFRIYWFAAKSLSIHTEFGLAMLIGPEGGTIFGNAPRNGFTLQSNEILLRIFEGDNAFGRLGMTFWW